MLDVVMKALSGLPPLLSALFRASLWGTAILASALGIAALLKRRAAEAHATLAAGILALPLIGAFSLLFAVSIPILPAPAVSTQESGSVSVSVSAGAAEPQLTAADKGGPDRLLAPLAETAWGLGLLVSLLRIVRSEAALRRLARTSRDVTDPRLLELAAEAVSSFRLVRAPLLVESRDVRTPLAFGVFHPVVALPESFGRKMEDSALRAILRHELAHLARRDNLTDRVTQVVKALFWFLPPVRFALRRLGEEREKACDAIAVARETNPFSYTRALVELARSHAHPFPALGIVDGRDGFRTLRNRIAFMIEISHSRKDIMKRKRALTVMLIAGTVIASMMAGCARLATASPSASAAGKSEASARPILHWPLRFAGQVTGSARFVITGPFGEIPNPLIPGKTYQHTGIDVSTRGAQANDVRHVIVVAAAPGQVSDEGFNPVAGNFVEVRHSDSMVTFYASSPNRPS